jgi:hypothetical protein
MRLSKTAVDRRERGVWNIVRNIADIAMLGVVATSNPSQATNPGAARSLAAQMPCAVLNPQGFWDHCQ